MNVNPRASSQKAPPLLEYQKDELCITKESYGCKNQKNVEPFGYFHTKVGKK